MMTQFYISRKKRLSAYKHLKVFATALFLVLFYLGLTLGPANSNTFGQNLVMVDGPIVKLSDLFGPEVIKQGKDIALAKSPVPGDDIVLPPQTLFKLARTYGVSMSPSQETSHTIIRRDGTAITRDDIIAALTTEIENMSDGQRYNISIPAHISGLILPRKHEASFDILDLNLDSQNKFFTATLAAPSKDLPIETIVIEGAIQTLITVPVINTVLRPGEYIKPSQISYVERALSGLPRDYISDISALQNMVASRIIEPMVPIRASDIELPEMVKRGELITLTYNDALVNLTAKAKALENGSKGDMVRVLNLGSRKDVQGLVTAPGIVTVF